MSTARPGPTVMIASAAVFAMLVAATGCGSAPATDGADRVGSGNLVFPLCQDPDFKSDYTEAERMRVCAAWHEGTRAGGLAGSAAAQRAVDDATRGGYRLRGGVAVGLGALGGALTGLLLGTLAAWTLQARRRRSTDYSELAVAALDGELRALRALAAGDALATHIADRLAAPLARLEAHAGRLGQRCHDARAAGDLDGEVPDPASAAHLDGLHDELDRLLARAERLRVRVTVWIEQQAGRGEDEAGEVDAALDAAVADLGVALAETS